MNLLPIVNHSLSYNRAIDGLRGVAILLVLLFHLFPSQFSFGYAGVDIFFVLSGFLITQIITTKMQNGSFSFAEFYRNRVRRIFPAMIVVLLTSLLVGYLTLFPFELKELANHIKSSAIFTQNFRLIHEAGYWDTASTLKPLLHFWSLSIEEQFYLFWPLIIWVIFRYRLDIFVSLAVIFLTLLLAPKLLDIDPFYHSLSRFWELSLGGLAFIASQRYKSFDIDKFTIFIVILFFVAIALAFDNHSYSLWRTLAITSTTAMLIMMLSNYPNHKIFGSKILVFLGLISFPLYLWHYMLIGYANIFGYDSLYAKLILATLSILLSYATYILIELRARANNSYKFAIFLFIIALLIMIVATFVKNSDGLPSRGHITKLNLQPPRPVYNNSYGLQMVNQILDKNTTIAHTKSNTTRISPNLVLMIGDSHSYAAYDGMSEELKKYGYDTLNISNNSSPAFIDITIGALDKKGIKSNNRNEMVYKIIKHINPKIVIFSSRIASYIANDDSTIVYNFYKDGKRVNGNNHILFMKELENVFAFFDAQGIQLHYILENPELDFSPELCMDRPFGISKSIECRVALQSYLNRNKSFNDEIYKIATKYPNIKVHNPQKAFCDSKYCYAKKDGKILYFDDDHLNAEGSRVQAKALIGDIVDKQTKIK